MYFVLETLRVYAMMKRVISHSHQSNTDTLQPQFFIYHHCLNKGQVWKQREPRNLTVLEKKTQQFIMQLHETTHMSITTKTPWMHLSYNMMTWPKHKRPYRNCDHCLWGCVLLDKTYCILRFLMRRCGNKLWCPPEYPYFTLVPNSTRNCIQHFFPLQLSWKTQRAGLNQCGSMVIQWFRSFSVCVQTSENKSKQQLSLSK